MDYDEKKLVIKWIFEGRCAICGQLEPLEVHHNTKPRRYRVDERPGDIVPFCWACHAIVEWLRHGATKQFKQFVRQGLQECKKLRLLEGRLRASLEQVGEWAEKEARPIRLKLARADQLLAAAEYELGFLQAMEDRWNEEHGRRAA